MGAGGAEYAVVLDATEAGRASWEPVRAARTDCQSCAPETAVSACCWLAPEALLTPWR